MNRFPAFRDMLAQRYELIREWQSPGSLKAGYRIYRPGAVEQ
ncbi:hypothetical protein [Terriglobus sp. RCC_193]